MDRMIGPLIKPGRDARTWIVLCGACRGGYFGAIHAVGVAEGLRYEWHPSAKVNDSVREEYQPGNDGVYRLTTNRSTWGVAHAIRRARRQKLLRGRPDYDAGMPIYPAAPWLVSKFACPRCDAVNPVNLSSWASEHPDAGGTIG